VQIRNRWRSGDCQCSGVGAASPREDRLSFMKDQIVFWLLAAIDGHAKNFSILHMPGGYKLTPLYDVMSTAPYPALSDHKMKLAMATGLARFAVWLRGRAPSSPVWVTVCRASRCL
jgi:serine/threonine-protein kinase HipA